MTDYPPTLAAALIQLQSGLPRVKKSVQGQVGNQKYKYADLEVVSEAILPELTKLGMAFIAKPTMRGERFVLAWELIHISGEVKDGDYPLPTGKPQDLGAAITYARRYALCAVTGLTPEGDDDDAAEKADRERLAGTARRTPSAARRASQQPVEGVQRAQRGQPPPLPGEGDALKLLGMVFTEKGITDREERLRITRVLVGRDDIETSKDLTPEESAALRDVVKGIRDKEALLERVMRVHRATPGESDAGD